MSDIAATIESSRIEENRQITVFRIAGMSETVVKRRALMNARIKGLGNRKVIDVQKLDETTPVGAPLYEVTVSSAR